MRAVFALRRRARTARGRPASGCRSIRAPNASIASARLCPPGCPLSVSHVGNRLISHLEMETQGNRYWFSTVVKPTRQCSPWVCPRPTHKGSLAVTKGTNLGAINVREDDQCLEVMNIRYRVFKCSEMNITTLNRV